MSAYLTICPALGFSHSDSPGFTRAARPVVLIMSFDIEKIGGAWSVVDQDGEIATLNDMLLVGLDLDDADDLADLLNLIESTRPALDH